MGKKRHTAEEVVSNPHAAENRRGDARAATLRRRARRWRWWGRRVWAELGERQGNGACGPPSTNSLRVGGGWCAENREFRNFGTTVVTQLLLGAIPACNAAYCSTAQ
ncbi:hypothetical protein LBMAG48_26640 [Phycisphaerae bacterium]|nr:hypothetical protein LBMAG48_26640 [Phycisphaerae bacterium]